MAEKNSALTSMRMEKRLRIMTPQEDGWNR
jgi:hypothetical protein